MIVPLLPVAGMGMKDMRSILISQREQPPDGLLQRDRYINKFGHLVTLYRQALGEVFAETLWPTRCAVCDRPDTLLCPACRMNLPYIDLLRACPVCASPFGSTQCTECNDLVLERIGRKSLPFTSCVSVVAFEGGGARLITVLKDGGELRLADTVSSLMADVIPPAWLTECDALSFIPASIASRRGRGFDHAELIARNTAMRLGMRFLPLLSRPRHKDQRALSRRERFRNMQGKFDVEETIERNPPDCVLLVDDVLTTGATLCAACDTLLEAGVREVRCATFARVR